MCVCVNVYVYWCVHVYTCVTCVRETEVNVHSSVAVFIYHSNVNSCPNPLDGQHGNEPAHGDETNE